MTGAFQKDGPRILLLEGANDCHVVAALCATRKLPESFVLFDCGSDDKVLKRLSALLLRDPQPEVIGVVMDADAPGLSGRWQQIKRKLADWTYNLPASPLAAGTIVEIEEGPKLGFWLMPDNVSDGMLEDFSARLAEPEPMEAARQAVTRAEKANMTRFKQVHRAKAEIHTYLAWQDEPGKPQGQAITAHALRADSPIADSFVKWLTELFLENDE